MKQTVLIDLNELGLFNGLGDIRKDYNMTKNTYYTIYFPAFSTTDDIFFIY